MKKYWLYDSPISMKLFIYTFLNFRFNFLFMRLIIKQIIQSLWTINNPYKSSYTQKINKNTLTSKRISYSKHIQITHLTQIAKTTHKLTHQPSARKQTKRNAQDVLTAEIRTGSEKIIEKNSRWSMDHIHILHYIYAIRGHRVTTLGHSKSGTTELVYRHRITTWAQHVFGSDIQGGVGFRLIEMQIRMK